MRRSHPLRVADYLQHILESISHIQGYTAGMNVDGFITDRKTSDAVIRNLEVIGEACNNIAKNHPDFATQHASVPWGFAYEMRNALAHGYFTVDLGIVWQTVRNDLPVLKDQVSKKKGPKKRGQARILLRTTCRNVPACGTSGRCWHAGEPCQCGRPDRLEAKCWPPD